MICSFVRTAESELFINRSGICSGLGVVVYASWAATLALAKQGSRRGLMTTLVLCAMGGLGNGLSIVACLPPCSGASPFGDISHIGSLVFGTWAMVESWQALNKH